MSLEIKFSPRISVKLRSQWYSWCIVIHILKNLQVYVVHLLNDTISISIITPEIKLRTFLICWFVSKENTGKRTLMKRLMDFSMYNILTIFNVF